MDELQQLKEKLAKLQLTPNPSLKLTIAMHSLEQMIKEREAKIKKQNA